MIRAAGLLALVVALVGCGGRAKASHVAAFELVWPHGYARSTTHVDVDGTPSLVVVGRTRLAGDGSWTCLGHEAAARYSRTAGGVSVELDDAAGQCQQSASTPIVGGFARGGGYVGEWSAGAVLSR